MGQDAELIFPPLPQGHPGLIHCWSRVRLAQAPPGPGSREEPRIASFCVRSESSGRPAAEPDVGSPASARSGCRGPRGPPAAVWLPKALMLLPSPPFYHVEVLLPAMGVGSPDGVAHVHPAENKLFARRLLKTCCLPTVPAEVKSASHCVCFLVCKSRREIIHSLVQANTLGCGGDKMNGLR